jgi:hypothetical protein
VTLDPDPARLPTRSRLAPVGSRFPPLSVGVFIWPVTRFSPARFVHHSRSALVTETFRAGEFSLRIYTFLYSILVYIRFVHHSRSALVTETFRAGTGYLTNSPISNNASIFRVHLENWPSISRRTCAITGSKTCFRNVRSLPQHCRCAERDFLWRTCILSSLGQRLKLYLKFISSTCLIVRKEGAHGQA